MMVLVYTSIILHVVSGYFTSLSTTIDLSLHQSENINCLTPDIAAGCGQFIPAISHAKPQLDHPKATLGLEIHLLNRDSPK